MKQPIISPYPNADLFQLVEEFTFKWSDKANNDFIWLKIEEGFIFDGASIPRIFWTTTGSPFMPKYIVPALIHDFLYKYQTVSRKKADYIFYKLLRRNEVSYYTSKKMYLALRAGGWAAWNKNKKKLITEQEEA